MIIESIVTTLDEEGRVNFAPMGVEWGEETIAIKPYQETTTYRNLTATGVGVINLTDNVLIFAKSAIANPVFATRPFPPPRPGPDATGPLEPPGDHPGRLGAEK